MSFVRYAQAEITGVKGSEKRLGRTASLDHFADYDDFRTDDGYIYVRVRAISSRVNKNHDGWPASELAKAYRTFLGKPIFVDHNNHDPKRARGVVVDAKLHVEDPSKTSALDAYYSAAPAEHLPPTWIELLLETDAKTFPKLAKAITDGEIDGVSMGCNVERSKCSHCGNWATVPEQYCQHIQHKGAEYDYFRDGSKTSKKSYEDCYDIGFFEISYVFDPADETALVSEIRAATQKTAAAHKAFGPFRDMRTQGPRFNAPQQSGDGACAVCGATGDPNSPACEACGTMRNPDQEREFTHNPTDLDYQMSGGIGDMFGAEKKHKEHQHGGCPVCGSRSIVWPQGNEAGLCGNCGSTVSTDDVGGITTAKTADTDQLPQAELLHAPQEVDTLRQEQVCPVCGNQIDSGKCDVCGFEEEPEGFGNPDLQKAQEVNQQQDQADMAAGQPGQPVPEAAGAAGAPTSPPAGPPQSAPAGQPTMPMAASTQTFTTTDQTVNFEYVSSDKTSATSGGVKGTPILPVTQQTSDRPKDERRVKDSAKPVQSSTREETMSDETKTAADNESDRLQSDQHRHRVVDVEGQGGVISEENPPGHQTVEVTGVGGVDSDENPEGHKEENLEASLKEEVGGPTKTWGKGEGDSLGQHTPVTGESATSLAATKRSLQILPAPEPDAKAKVTAPIKEEIGGPTKTWHRDEKHAPQNGAVTDEAFPGNAEAVKPEGKGSPDHSPFPPANEGVKSSSFGHFLTAMRLVKAEIALGLTPEEQELNRMAELENESDESIEAQHSALSKVKTAGLSKAASTKTSGRLPSLKQSSVERESSLRQVEARDDVVDLAESIFS